MSASCPGRFTPGTSWTGGCVGPTACLEAFELGYETSGMRNSLLSQFFFHFFFPTITCILWRICVRMHTSDCVAMYKNYRCYEIILWVKHFYTNRERREGLTGYLSLGCRHGRIRDNEQNSFQTSQVVAVSLTSQIVFLIAFLEEAFIRNIKIIPCIHHTI
jgi:hypothetical protein